MINCFHSNVEFPALPDHIDIIFFLVVCPRCQEREWSSLFGGRLVQYSQAAQSLERDLQLMLAARWK